MECSFGSTLRLADICLGLPRSQPRRVRFFDWVPRARDRSQARSPSSNNRPHGFPMLLMRSTSPINYLSGKRLRMPGRSAGLASIREEAIAMKPPPLYAAWAARARHRYVPSRELWPKSGRAQRLNRQQSRQTLANSVAIDWEHTLCVHSCCLSRLRVGHGFDCSPVLGFCSRTNQSQDLCKAHDRSAVKTQGSAAISRHTRGVG